MSKRAEKRRNQRQTFKLPDPEIRVASLYPNDRMSGTFATSVTKAMDYGWAIGRRLEWAVTQSSPRIAAARNVEAASFLDDTDLDWHVWIDSDMAFTHDAIHRLVDAAKEEGMGVLSGLCLQRNPDGYRPTARVFTGEKIDGLPEVRFVDMHELPEEKGIVRIDAVGTGFLAVHRKVYQAIWANRGQNDQPWFKELVSERGLDIGEDLSFCIRARSLGFDVGVDTRIGVGHSKSEVQGEVY